MDGLLKLVEEGYEVNGLEKIILPDPPDFMSYEAKCEFLRSVEDVVRKGLYEGPNIGLYESYCVAIGFAREFEQQLAEDGKIIGGKAHPAFKMMIDAIASARASWDSVKPKRIVINKEVKDDEENEWKDDKKLLA